jgi:hypothetical protein
MGSRHLASAVSFGSEMAQVESAMYQRAANC